MLSFTDNGNGTITDNNTGLVWTKKGDNGGLHDKDNFYAWTGNGAQETLWDWVDDVNATNFGGANDWRIPNARELLTIADFQTPWALPLAFRAPCAPGTTVLTGSCAFQASTWTSTVNLSSIVGGSPVTAWSLESSGSVAPTFRSSTLRARAVRGGTP